MFIIAAEGKESLLGTLMLLRLLLLLLLRQPGRVTLCLAFCSAAASIAILRFRSTSFCSLFLLRRGFDLLNIGRLRRGR